MCAGFTFLDHAVHAYKSISFRHNTAYFRAYEKLISYKITLLQNYVQTPRLWWKITLCLSQNLAAGKEIPSFYCRSCSKKSLKKQNAVQGQWRQRGRSTH